MDIYHIIKKKRDGGKLTAAEIDFWVLGAVSGQVDDYQTSALLMACFIRGMDAEETRDLTRSMLYSGEVLDLSDIPGFKVDKHSTGGVGDKTTLIVAAVLAAAGLKVAKMSGRGLGHTGGTVDKLESIPGYDANISVADFHRIVKDCGVAVIEQTAEIVPADKIFYALRDVTATIDSIPFIASSIMSKKLALGADHIVLDVTCGKGAFLKDEEQARQLSLTMVELAASLDRQATAVISAMDAPLGHAVGNALEIKEAVAILRGQPFDCFASPDEHLYRVCLTLSGELILQTGLAKTLDDGMALADSLIKSGAAWDKFRLMVASCGGDTAYIDDTSLLPLAACKREIKAPQSGYITDFDAEAVGFASLALGAGRHKKTDEIDYGAGIVIHRSVGDQVAKGDLIAVLYAASDAQCAAAAPLIEGALKIAAAPAAPGRLIKEIIRRK